jgi:hypothetical protein
MNEQELQGKLKDLRSRLKWYERHVAPDAENKGGKLSENQVGVISEFLHLLDTLNWQFEFNQYKELKCSEDRALTPGTKCGKAVKISPCGKEYEGKTYFGIYIGDVALSLGASIVEGVVTVSHSFSNPAILIPELGKVVYGCESWWGFVKSEEELKELITDETIKNVWYVKMLNNLTSPEE